MMELSQHNPNLSQENNQDKTNIDARKCLDEKFLSFSWSRCLKFVKLCKGNISKRFEDGGLEYMDFYEQSG